MICKCTAVHTLSVRVVTQFERRLEVPRVSGSPFQGVNSCDGPGIFVGAVSLDWNSQKYERRKADILVFDKDENRKNNERFEEDRYCYLCSLAATRHSGLPEVKLGVAALAGMLRLVRTVGGQRATEMALTGRPLPADEVRVDGSVMDEAIKIAEAISANSPDSVIVSREGIKLGWEAIGVEEGTRHLTDNWYGRIDD